MYVAVIAMIVMGIDSHIHSKELFLLNSIFVCSISGSVTLFYTTRKLVE